MKILIIRLKQVKVYYFEAFQLPRLCITTNSACEYLSWFLGLFDIFISITILFRILRYYHAILALAIFNIFKVND